MIVALCGQAGSGKDTLADILVRQKNFVKIAFADAMKRAVMDWFGFTEAQLWGPSAERNKPDPRWARTYDEFGEVTEYLTPRFALQQLGTEFGRACSKSVWVDYVIRVANQLDGREGISYDGPSGTFRCSRRRIEGIVISDCRFRNEIDAVRQAGGRVAKILRPAINVDAALSGAAATHRSETEQAEIPISAFDRVIVNSGTIADLEAQIPNLLGP